MSVEKVLVSVIAALFQGLAASYVIFKQVPKVSKTKKIIFSFLVCIYAMIVGLFIPNQLRFIIFIIVISTLMYFVLNIKDVLVILYAFNTEIFVTISEIIISLMLVTFGINSKEIVDNTFYNLLANFRNIV